MYGLVGASFGLVEEAGLAWLAGALGLAEGVADREVAASVTVTEVAGVAVCAFIFVVVISTAFASSKLVAAAGTVVAVASGFLEAAVVGLALATLVAFLIGFVTSSARAGAAGASALVFLFFAGAAVSTAVALTFFVLDGVSDVAFAAFLSACALFSGVAENERTFWQVLVMLLLLAGLNGGVMRGPAGCQLLPHRASMRIPRPRRDIMVPSTLRILCCC